MNKKSLLNILAFSTATLVLNVILISVPNATEADDRLEATKKQSIETGEWGELAGDFGSCQTAQQRENAIVSNRELDYGKNVVYVSSNSDLQIPNVQTNRFDLKNEIYNSLQICQ